MNFANILHSIAQADPEVYDRTSTRRRVIRNWMPKVALASLPMALGSLFNKAYGKSTDAIIETLQLALTLERLESSFYTMAVTKTSLFPSARPQDLAAITLIRDNETAHRDFVTATLIKLGGQGAVDAVPNKFDYTGGRGSNMGPFADVFTNYVTFLGVAQSFEETGIRAYKGGAPNLMSNNEVLTAALQLHSVEARHGAKLRQMRKENNHANIKPWITGTSNGLPAAAQPTYAGENNTLQGGVDTTMLGVSVNAATEAFDEPLGKDAVMAIAANFIAP